MKPFLHPLLLLMLLALLAGPVQAQQVNFGLSAAIGANEVLVSQPLNQAKPAQTASMRLGASHPDLWRAIIPSPAAGIRKDRGG